MTSDGGSYCQVYKLRRGWRLWVGDGWAEVRSVRVTGEHVLITMADGRVFRASYLDAVLCRPAAPALLAVNVRASRQTFLSPAWEGFPGMTATDQAAIACDAELAATRAVQRLALDHYAAETVDEPLRSGAAGICVTAAAGLQAARHLERAARNQVHAYIRLPAGTAWTGTRSACTSASAPTRPRAA